VSSFFLAMNGTLGASPAEGSNGGGGGGESHAAKQCAKPRNHNDEIVAALRQQLKKLDQLAQRVNQIEKLRKTQEPHQSTQGQDQLQPDRECRGSQVAQEASQEKQRNTQPNRKNYHGLQVGQEPRYLRPNLHDGREYHGSQAEQHTTQTSPENQEVQVVQETNPQLGGGHQGTQVVLEEPRQQKRQSSQHVAALGFQVPQDLGQRQNSYDAVQAASRGFPPGNIGWQPPQDFYVHPWIPQSFSMSWYGRPRYLLPWPQFFHHQQLPAAAPYWLPPRVAERQEQRGRRYDEKGSDEVKQGQTQAVDLELLLKRHNFNKTFVRFKEKKQKAFQDLLRRVFAENDDVMALKEPIKLSLLCPIQKKRMKHPSKSSLCMHLQCFDADSFLQMNRVKMKRGQMKCPICSVVFSPLMLEIDLFFMDVLAKTDKDQVSIHSDGSWTAEACCDEIQDFPLITVD